MKRKILITGGAGFVGINLASSLLMEGHDVVIIDSKYKTNRIAHRDLPRLRLIEFDLAETLVDDYIPEGITNIIHLAALPHVDYSYFYPGKCIKNNILSLTNILDFALKKEIPVAFASSVEVYGGTQDKPYHENDNLNPVSPYGASKQACESIINTYRNCFDMKVNTFRLTNLFGPYQLPDRIIPRFICRLIRKADTDIDGDFVRDFLFVEDAVKAIKEVMEYNQWGNVFNISSGEGTKMSTVARKILDAAKTDKVILDLKPLENKQRGKSLVIDNTKIKHTLKWTPEIQLEDGIQKTFKWYLENEDWWKQFENEFLSDRKTSKFIIDCKDENVGIGVNL